MLSLITTYIIITDNYPIISVIGDMGMTVLPL